MRSLTSAQHGLTLPEALAALLVVGVGLPALGLLQVESLRTLQLAGWQLAAVLVASDAAERLRSGIPGEELSPSGLPGLPPAARLELTPGAAGPPAMTRVRVEWPSHDGQAASFHLEVAR